MTAYRGRSPCVSTDPRPSSTSWWVSCCARTSCVRSVMRVGYTSRDSCCLVTRSRASTVIRSGRWYRSCGLPASSNLVTIRRRFSPSTMRCLTCRACRCRPVRCTSRAMRRHSRWCALRAAPARGARHPRGSRCASATARSSWMPRRPRRPASTRRRARCIVVARRPNATR